MKKMIAIVLALMLCVSALSVVAFAADGVEITIVAHESWEACYVYTWGETSMGDWPGTELTAGADGKYTFTLTGGIDGMVIGSGSGMPQSVDITDLDLTKAAALITIGEAGSDGKHAYTVSYDGGETTETPVEKPEEPVVIDAYYVTGSTETFGSWDAGNAAGKMTKGDDGVWSITFSDVAAGDYSVKVTIGNWDQSWGGSGENGNFDFTVAEAGEVTVKFNPSTEKVTVLVNGEEMNPGTGDMNLAAVSVALLAATAGVVALVGKKKEF